MNRYVAMPVAQNAPIGVGLLCPSDSVGNINAMNMGVVVDRKSFNSRSEEENAATATLERAAAAEYFSSSCTKEKKISSSGEKNKRGQDLTIDVWSIM